MSTDKIKVESENAETAPKGLTTNNNLFVGSTNELQQLLKDMKNNDG